MARKIPLNQLKKIFPGKIETGGNLSDLKSPSKDTRPTGVQDVSSDRITGKMPGEVLKVAMQPRKAVLILTPFMSENPSKASLMKRYANRCVSDSIKRSEAPMSSNLFFYDVLNMNVPIERDMGLASMLSWMPKCDVLAVYIDFGVTQAMQVVINTAQIRNRKIEYRMIDAVA